MARDGRTSERKGRGDDAEPHLPERLDRAKKPDGDPGESFEKGPEGYGADYGRETDRHERGYGPFGGGGDVGRSHGDFPATPNETSPETPPGRKHRPAPARKTTQR